MADEIKPIVLSDESVNVYGFRVLTKGIDLSQFKGNPVMLYNHRRLMQWNENKESALPIGKWVNVAKNENRLVASPEFDDDDDFAVKISKKYVKGYLNAASIGFDIIEVSEDPKMMVPGQTRPTVTKCILTEASITDIPGNRNCLKLTYQGKSVELDGHADESKIEALLPVVQLTNNQQNNRKMDKTLIVTTLGMDAEASDAQIVAKLTSLVNQQNTIDALQAKLAAMEKAQKDGEVKAMLDGAITAGKITEAQRKNFETLAAADFEGTKAALDSMPAYTPPNKIIENNEQIGAAGLSDAARYDDLDKKGQLAVLAQSQPDEFRRLLVAKEAELKQAGVVK